MKAREYKFSNFPIRYELEDYNQARDKYIQRIAGIADVKAMYQVGTISTPGISDIDLVIVLDDTLRHSSSKDYSINAVGGKVRYLFMHNPLIVNKSIFKEFLLFPHAEHLKSIKLVGETVTIEDGAVKGKPVNRIADVIDNMGSLLRYFTFIVVSGYCPVRMALTKLNALSMNINDFRNIAGQSKPSWDEFVHQVKILRKGWFFLKQADQKHQLAGLLKKAFHISYGVNFALQHYLTDAGYITAVDSTTPFIAQQSFLRFSVFSKSSDVEILDVWRKVTGSLNEQYPAPYKLFLVFFPFAFCLQWACYSEGEGEFSRSFKRYLPFRQELKGMIKSAPYRDILLRRMKFLDKQIAFLKIHKFSYGLLAQLPVKPSFYGAKRNSIRRVARYPIERFLGISNKHRLNTVLRRMELQ